MKPELFYIPAKDGFPLACRLFEPKTAPKACVVINSATAVRQEYYTKFATFLKENGYAVLTYDYRGIAHSRPKKLRGFEANFTTWGDLDCAGIIIWLKNRFPDLPIGLIGHSIGGVIIGFMEENKALKSIITVASQTAYYQDFAPNQRAKIYFQWHILIPFLTYWMGYFPGKKLRMLEDVPKGVVKQWHNRRKNPDMISERERESVFFHQVNIPFLSIGLSDDPIGTLPALERLNKLYEKADLQLQIIHPHQVHTDSIGHFGFFKSEFKPSLWTKALDWFDNTLF